MTIRFQHTVRFKVKGTIKIIAVTWSGILKAKQKLGITFNSDKLGNIDFIKFSKLTMSLGGTPGH